MGDTAFANCGSSTLLMARSGSAGLLDRTAMRRSRLLAEPTSWNLSGSQVPGFAWLTSWADRPPVSVGGFPMKCRLDIVETPLRCLDAAATPPEHQPSAGADRFQQ